MRHAGVGRGPRRTFHPTGIRTRLAREAPPGERRPEVKNLAALGPRFQLRCIAHLPQIAASGLTHFLIEKQVKGSRTVTSVTRLTDEDRVPEIARMMGGSAAGVKALESARELLETAQAKGEAEAKAKGERPRRAKAKLK